MRYLFVVALLVTALVPGATLAQGEAACTIEDLEQDLTVLERLVSATRDTLADGNAIHTLSFFEQLQTRVSTTLSDCDYVPPGSGTLEDPYTFGEAGDTGAGFSLRVIGFTRPGNQLVYRANMFNDRPGAGLEYLVVKVAVLCDQGSAGLCNVNERDIDLVGSQGQIYDTTFVAYDDELDVELLPGGTGEGDLVYLIRQAEQDLKILYRPSFGNNRLVAFEAIPATGSGIPVTSTASLNVRGGPGTQHAVVANFPRGEADVAIGRNEDGSWLQISTGWVFTALVETDGDVMSLAVVSQ